jgi:hypothetical protein
MMRNANAGASWLLTFDLPDNWSAQAIKGLQIKNVHGIRDSGNA